MLLFAMLAVIAAGGMCVQGALAADLQVTEEGHGAMSVLDHWVPNVDTATTAPVLQGPVMWDDGTVEPPCFAPNAPCSSDPAGGVNVGLGLSYWPIMGSGTGSTCNNVKKQACGQIDSFVETTTGSGAVSAKITITQGTTVIYSHSLTGLGTVSAGKIVVVSLAGIKLRSTAVAGKATIKVVTTVGTAKATGKTTVVLM